MTCGGIIATEVWRAAALAKGGLQAHDSAFRMGASHRWTAFARETAVGTAISTTQPPPGTRRG
ncbi:MAG: hypothetical protein U0992_14130 [Planctomycetaceae bacterium]